MLHEIAHCCGYSIETEPLPGHGWHFAAIMLDLVERQMGKAAHQALAEEFKARRVRYRKPRQLSPEHRTALSARMAALRGRKVAEA